jgi:hypothetical protein
MFPRSARLFGLPAVLSTVLVLGSAALAAPVAAADPPGWTSEVVAPPGVARAHLPGVELEAARDGRLIGVAERATADRSSVGLTIVERSAGATGNWRLLAKTSWSDVSPSLALSAGGAVSLAFVRQGSGLRFTSNRTGTWRVEAIPGTNSRSFSPSLALTSGGTPSIAYTAQASRTSATIRIASRTASGWTTRTIATGDVSQPSLRIDQWSKRHLVYVRNAGTSSGLYYATDRSGTWKTIRIAAARDVSSPRLVLDLARHVHVAYVRGEPLAPRVMHVTNVTGAWRTTTASLAAEGSSPDITLDVDGRPIIAYVAGRPDAPASIWIAEGNGTAWTRTQATGDAMFGRPGVAIVGIPGVSPANGRLHVLALRPFADLDGELVHAARD